jgi:glycosyltransferase involved in cell wall biosynthesis
MLKMQLKINFFIPFVYKTGGIAVVLEYYRLLAKMGHDVIIYYPMIPYYNILPEKDSYIKKIFLITRYFIKKLFFPIKKIKWYYEPVPVRPIFLIKNLFVRNADICIATAWPTAYDVNRLSPHKGKNFYFVQHFEIWSGLRRLVEESYTLPLHIITIAPWLTSLLKEKFNKTVSAEIHNGIRLDKFVPGTKDKDHTITLLMIYHEVEIKGSKEGLLALEHLKRIFPQIKIIIFGMPPKPNAYFEYEYYRDPSSSEIVTIYHNADIFIWPSHLEGWGLPIMEAMACRCSVISTRTGCVPLINNGKNLVIIRSKSPTSIIRACKLLILDPSRREKIAEEGYKSIQKFKWENSAKKMELLFIENVSK